MMDGSMRWVKSSYSQNLHTCVELSSALDGLRDSKDPGGPVLRADVRTFLRAVRSGRFDHD